MYIGATGPVLQRLAGAITQGLLTASITTPKFAAYSRSMMEEGAKRAGRDGSQLDLGCVVVGSVGEDAKTAREGAREMAAMYLANKVQNIKGSADTLLECAGLNLDEIQPIADAMEKGGRKSAARAVSDVTLDKVCPVAGSPKQCIEKLEEYHAAGCTQMMLELWGDDRLGQARLFGEKVLPHFRKK
jgi:alkanesulfonate monooxygenase SsuD/methylene tetrahydromethanopterin reductase-like flavin-dependent oxidoreductase (luciferase family)